MHERRRTVSFRRKREARRGVAIEPPHHPISAGPEDEAIDRCVGHLDLVGATVARLGELVGRHTKQRDELPFGRVMKNYDTAVSPVFRSKPGAFRVGLAAQLIGEIAATEVVDVCGWICRACRRRLGGIKRSLLHLCGGRSLRLPRYRPGVANPPGRNTKAPAWIAPGLFYSGTLR